jgi:hypothetical protein
LNVPLVAVELAYGPDFELGEDDAEILVQLRSRDVMWQKERLLNVALQELPDDCRKVIWVDCDIIFASSDWPQTVSRQLDRFMILQAFGRVHHLPRDWTLREVRPSDAEFSRGSVGFGIASEMPAVELLSERPQCGSYSYSRGFTWAARRDLFERHGLYDACIVGAGDRAMAAAAYGCYDAVIDLVGMNDRQRERYLAWAKPFHETIGTAVGWTPGDIYHLWHGEMRDRASIDRHGILRRFEFDPFEDIAIDHIGIWRWNSDKPQMHACVREYFAARKEDG